jgi:hypothetical protein
MGKCLQLRPPANKVYIFSKELKKDWEDGKPFVNSVDGIVTKKDAEMYKNFDYTHIQFINSRGTSLCTIDI